MITIPEKPWYAPLLISFLGEDVPRLLGLSPSAFDRDILTLCHRLAFEGESFLTKTLPALGKAIDRALGGHGPLVTRLFRKKRRGDARPAFLQVLLSRVFTDEGEVAVNPCHQSIKLLRQLCYWCKKVKKGYSDESLRQAMVDFIKVDCGLPIRDTLPRNRARLVAQVLVERVVGLYPRSSRFEPKHGPGAVADGSDVMKKRKLRTKYSTLESVFRPIPYFFSLRDASEAPQRITDRIDHVYGLSRVEFVEKDSSGPRTIGLEPAEYMWCQQAVKGWLYSHIESCRYTKGRVNFTDQSINQALALDWQAWDTLDMSKASDRNSLALVEALFGKTWIWPYLQACRTPGAVLPDGTILWYKKFAPMGSAVCFPVQALVYWALACAILHTELGVPLGIAMRSVYVYGDDLIVPHGLSRAIIDGFEVFSLKFNIDKCFFSGKFRESCGVDAFDGTDVTPVRFARPHHTKDKTTLIPLIEHANNLARAGYWSSALFLRSYVGRFLRLPCSPRDDLPFLTWYDLHDDVRYRCNKDTGITYAFGWAYRPMKVEANADDEMRYLRESLSHGGPVGVVLPLLNRKGEKIDPSKRMPRVGKRVFTLRFRGKLVHRRYVVQPPGYARFKETA